MSPLPNHPIVLLLCVRARQGYSSVTHCWMSENWGRLLRYCFGIRSRRLLSTVKHVIILSTLLDTRRVVPLPLYDTAGKLIVPSTRILLPVPSSVSTLPCQLYPYSLVHSSFGMQWCSKYLCTSRHKVLVDALPLKPLKKQRTAREEPVLKRDPRRGIFEAQMVGKV